MKTARVALLVFGACVLWSGNTGRAEVRTFSYEGVVTAVFENPRVLDGSIVKGTPLTFTLSFNTVPQSRITDPFSATYYYYEEAPTGMTMLATVGKYSFRSQKPPGAGHIYIYVGSNCRFYVLSPSITCQELKGEWDDTSMELKLASYHSYLFTGFDLPETAPDVSSFETDLSIWLRSSSTGKVAQINAILLRSVPAGSTGVEGLVAHWKLDETSGTTAADASGNNRNGTLCGEPVWEPGGKLGGALSFDGVNDYVDCGNSLALNIQDQITLACWIKAASFTRNWQTILAKGDHSYRLSRSSVGDSIFFGLGGTSVGGFDGAGVVTDDQWHHIAAVYDGSDATLYIDGVADTIVPTTGKISSNSHNLFLAENSQTRGRYFKGLLDDVRVYSCALSETEVGWAMLGVDSDPNLLGRWKLDETGGDIVHDSTAQNDGVAYGGPVWQPAGGKIAGALSFDGINDYVQLPIGSMIGSLTDSTFATWVNWTGVTDQQRIFDFGSGQAINMFLTPRNGVTGSLQFAITAAGGEDQVTSPQILPTGWHHVAVTIDAASKIDSLYVDGQLEAAKTAAMYTPNSLGVTTQNWLGRSQYPDPYFAGSLDDFRIYSRVLTAEEVAQLGGP